MKLSKMPRALRRTVIKAALSDPANVPSIRSQLADLKAYREEAAKLVRFMDEAIEDCEALLGEVHA